MRRLRSPLCSTTLSRIKAGLAAADLIREQYGDVADHLLACTHSNSQDPAKKTGWEDRKRAHLDKLTICSLAVARITPADKHLSLSAPGENIRPLAVRHQIVDNMPAQLLEEEHASSPKGFRKPARSRMTSSC